MASSACLRPASIVRQDPVQNLHEVIEGESWVPLFKCVFRSQIVPELCRAQHCSKGKIPAIHHRHFPELEWYRSTFAGATYIVSYEDVEMNGEISTAGGTVPDNVEEIHTFVECTRSFRERL